MKKKFYIALVILLTLAFTTKVFASLTFDSTSIIGTNSSTIDLGSVSNTLSLQTANNGPIITGTGLFTTGGNLSVTGNVGIGTTIPRDKLHVSGGNIYLSSTQSTANSVVSSISAMTNGYGPDSSFPTARFASIEFLTGPTTWSTGGQLVFKTNRANDATTAAPTEAMRIDNAGNVGIGTTSPNANAILDVTSTTKAFMPPRMTKAQRDAVASPAAGMAIYQTDNTPGLRVYNGTNWMRYTETAD